MRGREPRPVTALIGLTSSARSHTAGLTVPPRASPAYRQGGRFLTRHYAALMWWRVFTSATRRVQHGTSRCVPTSGKPVLKQALIGGITGLSRNMYVHSAGR